jgi:cyclopropane fatty-acyl-phospholipid synthase-like methyltransferase
MTPQEKPFLYREVLYSAYSAAFGARKALTGAGEEWAFAEAAGPNLPADRGAAIADLGCGRGQWLGWLAQAGYERLTGVDLCAEDLESARGRQGPGNWVEADVITWLEAQPPEWDLLHAKDIIEHFTKDEFIRFLRAARGAMRPGGRLWLLTFNAQSPMSGATRHGDFTHESAHTPSSLAQCLRACGFAGLRIEGRHYCPPTLTGRGRRMAGKLLYGAARFGLKVRHGQGAVEAGVDHFTAAPDLFAEAVKPTGGRD